VSDCKFIKVHKDPFQQTNLFLYIKISCVPTPAGTHIDNFSFIGLNNFKKFNNFKKLIFKK